MLREIEGAVVEAGVRFGLALDAASRSKSRLFALSDGSFDVTGYGFDALVIV